MPTGQQLGVFAHGAQVTQSPTHGGLVPVHGGLSPIHGAKQSFYPAFTINANIVQGPPRTFVNTAGGIVWGPKAIAGPYTGDMGFDFLINTPPASVNNIAVGLSDNAAHTSNAEILYNAFFFGANGSIATSGGGGGGAGTNPGVTAKHRFRRVGTNVIYSLNGVDIKTWAGVLAATPLYFIMSLADPGDSVSFDTTQTL